MQILDHRTHLDVEPLSKHLVRPVLWPLLLIGQPTVQHRREQGWPEDDEVRSLTRMQLLRTVAAWRPDYDDFDHPATATRIAMRSLARRILELNNEVADLDDLIEPLVTDLGARLIERPCIRIETAGQLLVTAGRQPGAYPVRSRLGDALRRGAATRLLRQD